MTFNIYPLIEALEKIDTLFVAINKYWLSQYGEPGIYPVLQKKIEGIKSGTIKGIMLFYNQSPTGIAWTEKVTAHYGNMVIFSLNKKYQSRLVKAFIKTGYLDGAMLELVKFEDTRKYEHLLMENGLIRNERERMAWFPPEDFDYPQLAENVSFCQMKKKDAHISGKISYEAHQVSSDYVGYPDLASEKNRVILEKTVFNGIYGNIVEPASIFIKYKNEIIGSCLIVETKCWGYEKVAWIFDIVILPKFQGKGFGRQLINQSLAILNEKKYSIVGLSVTLSNTHAIRMYEKLGFQHVENFSEFAYKTL